MTDAEKLMVGFIPAVSASPFAIAPERAEELNEKIFGGTAWVLNYTSGGANFVAHPDDQEMLHWYRHADR